jgi:acyl-CoA dehydrogenase
MPYHAPVSEYSFVLNHLVGFDRVRNEQNFRDCTPDMVAAILTEAAKLSDETLAPLNIIGDRNPAKLENGIVLTAPGFGQAYAQIATGGWVGMAGSPDFGGMGLPMSVVTCVNEMMSAACLSLELNPLMAQGQIEALEHHASDAIKALYLPKLISGQWCATMNLTEPQAGSDVGALRATAHPREDGTYAITGQKIYITWGDNDFSENVCHLVLARLPDGVAGTRGISLFMVPKIIPDAHGNLGPRNNLNVVSLEHKLGIHGAPTAVMHYENATGWLIGEPHKGMTAMFTMMNNARLGVAAQGVAIADAATQHALAYATQRKQGLTPMGETAIFDHADVRRMLGQMRAEVFAARSIALSCAVAIDLARATGSADWAARAALLTPIAKAFCTDIGSEVASLGVQIHGGMGYIEDTGAAQYLRDARITAIYEGTNGIQAMDLVGRKMMDGGTVAFALMDEWAAQSTDHDLTMPVLGAIDALRAATHHLLSQGPQYRNAGAVAYLRGFARVMGAAMHLRAAKADPARAPLAAFYIDRLLPETAGLFAQSRAGATGVYALGLDALSSS